MTTIVRVHRKGQMTLPSAMRIAMGIAEGDLIEATVSRGKIVLTPKSVVDRSGFPNADDEYTPQQRRAIDVQLRQAEKGPFQGPFETADEMISHLKAELKKPVASKRSKQRR